MFGLFKPKKTESVMDALVKTIYGDPPPEKRADVGQAVGLAFEMLMGQVPESTISGLARDLYEGPLPYSTHDLAVSVALNFFKNPEYQSKLKTAQLMARLSVLEWVQEGKVAPLLVKSFEETLYKIYK